MELWIQRGHKAEIRDPPGWTDSNQSHHFKTKDTSPETDLETQQSWEMPPSTSEYKWARPISCHAEQLSKINWIYVALHTEGWTCPSLHHESKQGLVSPPPLSRQLSLVCISLPCLLFEAEVTLAQPQNASASPIWAARLLQQILPRLRNNGGKVLPFALIGSSDG